MDRKFINWPELEFLVDNICKQIQGVKTVYLADDAAYANDLPEVLAPLVVHHAARYKYVMSSASTFGKNLLPRVSAMLDVQQISDISDIQSERVFVRPIYAGNAMAVVESSDEIKVITVRSTSFDPGSMDGGVGTIEIIDSILGDPVAEFVGQELTPSERPELTSAGIVISGGRGMQSGDNFYLIENVFPVDLYSFYCFKKIVCFGIAFSLDILSD